jgi:hypothetical protein
LERWDPEEILDPLAQLDLREKASQVPQVTPVIYQVQLVQLDLREKALQVPLATPVIYQVPLVILVPLVKVILDLQEKLDPLEILAQLVKLDPQGKALLDPQVKVLLDPLATLDPLVNQVPLAPLAIPMVLLDPLVPLVIMALVYPLAVPLDRYLLRIA